MSVNIPPVKDLMTRLHQLHVPKWEVNECLKVVHLWVEIIHQNNMLPKDVSVDAFCAFASDTEHPTFPHCDQVSYVSIVEWPSPALRAQYDMGDVIYMRSSDPGLCCSYEEVATTVNEMFYAEAWRYWRQLVEIDERGAS